MSCIWRIHQVLRQNPLVGHIWKLSLHNPYDPQNFLEKNCILLYQVILDVFLLVYPLQTCRSSHFFKMAAPENQVLHDKSHKTIKNVMECYFYYF